MTNQTRPRLRHSWKRRPKTQTYTFRFASLAAMECGLYLNAANNLECAQRIARFWLSDPVTKTRVATAENLVEIMEFLADYRASQSLAGRTLEPIKPYNPSPDLVKVEHPAH